MSAHLVLICGQSGSGKTTLAKSLRHKVQLNSGYFLSGKFELTTIQDPYAVLVSALSQFIDGLLRDTSKQGINRQEKIREIIQGAVGLEGRLVTSIVPSLESFIIFKNDACEIHGNEAQRVQFLFGKIFRAISAAGPLVLFLDDLQWSDLASLQLLQAILQSRASNSESRFLVVGSYREECAGEEDRTTSKALRRATVPFLSYLDQFSRMAESSQLKLTKIHLQALDMEATNKLVAGFLGFDPESTASLSRAVFSKSQGNPYHALQILKALRGQGSLRQESNLNFGWEWNENDVSTLLAQTETLDDLVRHKLAALPCLLQKVLQVAACLGDEIDETAVAIVLDTNLSDVELSVKAAGAEGHLMLDRHRGNFRFSHDRVRNAALSMVEDRDALFFSVGLRLWTCASTIFLSENMFIVANLLNHGTALVTDKAERYRAATLNLEAGVKASSLTAFPDACRYLSAGIEFLKGGDYWSEQYDLALNLFNAAADAELCVQHYPQVEAIVAEVCEHGRTLHDKLPALVAHINALGQNGRVEEAIEAGLDVLRQLNEPLPRRATKAAIALEVVKTKIALLGCSTEDTVLRLRSMEDKDKLLALHVLKVLLPDTYQVASFYNPLMGTRIVCLALKFGLHKSCAVGFCTFGWVLCGAGDSKEHRMGSLALAIARKCRARELIPRVHIDFYGMIHHWRSQLRDSLEPLQKAVQEGMEIGDIEAAMIASYFACNHSFFCGIPLNQLETMLVEATKQMRRHKQDTMLRLACPFLQLIHNLTGRAANFKVLSGEAMQLHEDPTENVSVRSSRCAVEASLAFIFKDLELAQEKNERKESFKFVAPALFWFVAMRQTDALIAIGRARLGLNMRRAYRFGRQCLSLIRAKAAACPENFAGRQYLLEAELMSLKNHSMRIDEHVQSLYRLSVSHAKSQGFIQEAALASELAGDYMSRQGDLIQARNYWEEAHSLYLTWGATEKAAQLSASASLHQAAVHRAA